MRSWNFLDKLQKVFRLSIFFLFTVGISMCISLSTFMDNIKHEGKNSHQVALVVGAAATNEVGHFVYSRIL